MDYIKMTKNEIIEELKNTLVSKDSLQEQLSAKQGELQELRKLYDTLKSSNTSSTIAKNTLDKQIKTLTDDRDKKASELASLRADFDKLSESSNVSSTHVQEVENIRDRLVKENTDLKQQCGQLYNDYKEYRVYSESLLKALQGSLELGIDLLYKTSGEKYNKGD